MRGSTFPGRADRERVTVLGLGNILLSDEGVGVYAAAALSERFIFSPSVDIIDGGTMGLDLLPLFQDRDRILIIDAVDFGKDPGHIGIVEGDAIRSVLNTKLSVHHIGLADLLFTAKLTREDPLELCLIGIQPHSLETGVNMTAHISGQFDNILKIIVHKLKQWNVVSRAKGTND